MTLSLPQTRKHRRPQATRSHASHFLKSKLPAVRPAGGELPLNQTLPQAVGRIAQSLRPEKIILFGSYAYGRPNADSDVDLLVVMRTKASPKERHLAVCRLLRPRPFAVDLLVRTPQEIKIALQRGDFFIQEIMTRGQVLYERSK